MSRLSAGLVENESVVSYGTAGTYKLNDNDHGKVHVIEVAAGGVHFTLPLPQRGYRAKFVCGVDLATSNCVITASGAIVAGQIASPGVGAATAGTEKTTITFVQAVADIGDTVELVSDGTNWFMSGAVGVSNAVTLA